VSGIEPGHSEPEAPPRTFRITVRSRWAAVLAVAAVVAVVAVVDAVVATPVAAPAPGTADGVAVPPGGASSSSAFCAAGTGTAAATTIYLTNSTAAPVTGVMTSFTPAPSSGTAPTTRRTVLVPARGSAAVNPSQGLPPGDTASTFVFDGGGVVANQVVAGPTGWSTAPCASAISSEWAFAGGSTTGGNDMTLSLVNPAATAAVVDVTFLTARGMIGPQAYQGLVVPPGQLVTENVATYVQNASNIATFVTAQSGAVVSDLFQQWSSGAASGLSLQLGAPALSTQWQFAQTTSAPGSTVTFTLANPGSAPVDATLSVGLASGSVVPQHVTVAPASTDVFTASNTPGMPRQVPFSLQVDADGPIVVGRSVENSASTTAPAWGASMGTVTKSTRWLVPAPGVPLAPGTANASIASLAVADPGTVPARVVVQALAGVKPRLVFTVAPGRIMILGPTQVGGLAVLTVSSSVPVVVEEDSGPSAAPGVISSTGFPSAD